MRLHVERVVKKPIWISFHTGFFRERLSGKVLHFFTGIAQQGYDANALAREGGLSKNLLYTRFAVVIGAVRKRQKQEGYTQGCRKISAFFSFSLDL